MRMQLTAKQMIKGNQKGVNQGGGLLICMQMFQVYVTDLVMNSTVMMETTCRLWGMYKRSEPIKWLHSVQNHMANVYSSEVCLQTKNFPKISKFFFFQKHSKI